MWRMLDKASKAGQSVLSATDRWFEPTADVILRVPSLVLLDYCWRFELENTLLKDSSHQFGIFNTVIAASLLVQAVAVLLLPLEYVVRLYMHYISGAVLVLSHQFSLYHISSEATRPAGPGLDAFFRVVPVWRLWAHSLHPGGEQEYSSLEDAPSEALHALPVQFLRRQLAAMAVHLTAAAVVIVLLEVEDTRRRVSLLAHAVPVVALMANIASGAELLMLHNCAGALTILSCLTWLIGCVPACLEYYHQLYLKYYFHATMVYDSAQMARQVWRALFTPRLYLCYWLCLTLTQLHHLYQRVPAAAPPPHLALLTAVAAAAASPLSLLTFCVAGGYGSWGVVRLLRFLLKTPAPPERQAEHSGWVEAVQMLLLSMQVDLIHQQMPARLALVAVVLFVAVTSTGQTVYEVTESAVLALSASGSRRLARHAAVVATCLTLVSLPVKLTLMLFGLFGFDLWVLVLGSSALTLTLQAVGLLTIYGVFVFDTLRQEPWQHLDGVVYVTRAAAGLAQLVVALLVVATGVYESARGHWSWASAAILLAHGYFNVWQRLREGWAQFLQRRAAARTSRQLPAATQAQVRAYGDVCAICYSAMTEARQLPCRHLFHGVCLRKWLYVQNTCPMCQMAIVAEGGGEKQESATAGDDDAAGLRESRQDGGGEGPVEDAADGAAAEAGAGPGSVNSSATAATSAETGSQSSGEGSTAAAAPSRVEVVEPGSSLHGGSSVTTAPSTGLPACRLASKKSAPACPLASNQSTPACPLASKQSAPACPLAGSLPSSVSAAEAAGASSTVGAAACPSAAVCPASVGAALQDRSTGGTERAPTACPSAAVCPASAGAAVQDRSVGGTERAPTAGYPIQRGWGWSKQRRREAAEASLEQLEGD